MAIEILQKKVMGTEQQKGVLLCVDCLWNKVGRRAAWVACVTDGAYSDGAYCGLALGVPMSGCTF